MANALLKKIDKKAPSTGSKSTVKIAAEVNDDVKNAVDLVIAHKAEIARLAAEQAQHEQTILDHVTPQYEENGFKGNFTKSLTVEGKTGSLTFTRNDSFSVPQDEATLETLKETIKGKYVEFFETVPTVSIKSNALQDENIINKMVKACEKAGLDVSDIFENSEKVVAKKGLDRNQFSLGRETHEVFKTLVRQNKPSLK